MKKRWIAMIMAIAMMIGSVAWAEEVRFYSFEAYTVCKVNLREGPGTTYHRLMLLPEKTGVKVTGESENWWQVEYQEQQGYIRKDLLSKGTEESYVGLFGVSFAGYTTVKVNFRETPSLEATILETLPKGTEVTVVGIAVDWLQVEYQEKTGFIYGKYVAIPQSDEETDVYVATANVHLRAGAGTEHSSLRVIRRGKEVILLKKENDWFLVNYKGTTGYVCSYYLESKDAK